MYVPDHFREDRPEVLHEAVRRIGFATLVTQGLEANHLPMLFQNGMLRGHVARANPVWKSGEGEALAIFLGPHAYVSPSWYPSKAETGKAVPTWNYIAVHAKGPIRWIQDADWLRGNVTALSDANEAGREQPWKISDAPASYIDTMLRAIVGFELQVQKLEGKWKLSQNRDAADRAGACDGLMDDGHEDVARLMINAETKLKLMPRNDWLRYGGLLLLGAVLYIVCRLYPADLPVWLPWEFSWPIYLATVLTLAWFFRGLKLLPRERHPPLWRLICFVLGMASFWVVLQTRIDYYAQHMFFVHRWAHFVLHHAGAFLIALGMSGPVLLAGMPDFLKPVAGSRPVQATLSFLQHPVMAPFLFVGLLYFWLIPQIHTRVMLDANLYELMNWTMAVNGVMFWSLILDSRAKPPARLSHLMRAALILVIELPQMVLGAVLSLTEHDIYPVYTICGRVLDMTALNDQHYGGLIIWLPGTLTSFAAMIVVLVTMRLNEEKAALEENKSEAA